MRQFDDINPEASEVDATASQHAELSSSSRRALVTGSAQGIGSAIANRLASEGVDVIGIDVLPSSSSAFTSLTIDLLHENSLIAAVRRIGDIDILINNAAILIEGRVPEFSREDFDTTVGVNLRAPFVLAQAVLPAMVANGWGRIVNISSIGAHTGGLFDSGPYAMTKAGLLAMTKNIARTFGPSGVTCNAIAPGAIKTPMVAEQHMRHPTVFDQMLDQIPVGRWGTPEDVAGAVSFLVGADASFVNGVTLDINGGWVMR